MVHINPMCVSHWDLWVAAYSGWKLIKYNLAFKGLIVFLSGLQGNLWTETVRSVERAHDMLFPRTLALAERSWHRGELWEDQPSDPGADAARQKSWEKFARQLTVKELPRLEKMGVAYNVPPPGVRYVKAELPLQAANCCHNSRLVVDEDHLKWMAIIERTILLLLPCWLRDYYASALFLRRDYFIKS